MSNYDKMAINAYYLEPPAIAALNSGKVSLEVAFSYSQAISLKRLADSEDRKSKITAGLNERAN